MSGPTSLDRLPPAPPETLRQRATYWQYRALWELVARAPEPVARRLPGSLGRLWHRLAPARQRSWVRAHLARITDLPPGEDLERLVEAAYVSYTRYWVDAFRLHTYTTAEVVARSSEEGLERVDEVLAGGEGAILATGHLGSWDVGAMFAAERGWDLAVVAEVLRPRRLFEEFVRLREEAGVEVVPLIRDGGTAARLAGVVERGGLPTLLADRDLTGSGPIVDFFGEPCRMPAGPAVLARRTGRPVAVGAFVTEGRDGWRAVVHDVVDVSDLPVEEGTQRVTRLLEGLIARYPEQWHVFVPNWLAEREPDHPRVAEARPGPRP